MQWYALTRIHVPVLCGGSGELSLRRLLRVWNPKMSRQKRQTQRFIVNGHAVLCSSRVFITSISLLLVFHSRLVNDNRREIRERHRIVQISQCNYRQRNMTYLSGPSVLGIWGRRSSYILQRRTFDALHRCWRCLRPTLKFCVKHNRDKQFS